MAVMSANGRVLQVDLNSDTVRAITGSMVAYTGVIDFKNAGMGGGDGFKAAMKRRVVGESISLMECTGTGRAYLAVKARDVYVIDLSGDTLTVESDSILAVSAGLRLDVKFAGLHGMTSGQGLATTTVSGAGQVAVISDGPMIGLEVWPGQPVVVDPDAYIANNGQLSLSMVSGVSWKSVIGEGSGEPFSLRFDGSGIVYIQPAER